MAGPGTPRCGVLVRPRPDEALARHVEVLEHPEYRVRVPVGPAARGEDRNLHGRVVLAHRPPAPVVVAALVSEPLQDPRLGGVEALVPHVPPPFPHDGRVGRQGRVREHRPCLGQVVREQAAAHVVHVVGVAVVGERRDDDRPEARRPARRDLKTRERAPGDAHEPGAAGAPGLGREPAERRLDVAVLLLGVLVLEHAVGVAAAAQVQAQARVPVAREVGVVDRVAHRGQVALPVGDRLADAGRRCPVRRHRPPQASREPGAVGHRDPHVLGGAQFVLEGRDRAHQANSKVRRSTARSYFATRSASSLAPTTTWASS